MYLFVCGYLTESDWKRELSHVWNFALPLLQGFLCCLEILEVQKGHFFLVHLEDLDLPGNHTYMMTEHKVSRQQTECLYGIITHIIYDLQHCKFSVYP